MEPLDSPRYNDFSESPRFTDSARSPTSLFPDDSPRKLLDASRVEATKQEGTKQERPIFTRRAPHRSENVRDFTYTKLISIPEDKNQGDIVSQFNTTNKVAAGFHELLERASQFLFERTAQPKHIEKSHAEQSKVIDEKNKELTRHISVSDTNSKYIPLLDDLSHISTAITQLFTFKVLNTLLKRTYKKIAPVLTAPEYNQALEFYKKQKKKCKELRNEKDPAQKVDKLSAIFQDAKTHIEKIDLAGKAVIIVAETSSLYKELLEFITYTSAFVPKPPKVGLGWKIVGYGWAWGTPAALPTNPNDVPELAAKINALKKNALAAQKELTERANSALAAMPSLRKTQSFDLDTSATERFLAACERTSLEQSSAFRRGWFAQAFLYSDMSKEIEGLQRVARGLAKELSTLEARMLELTVQSMQAPNIETLTKEIAEYELHINGLENKIEEEVNKVKHLPLSGNIHAPWYYAARLREKADDVRMYIQQFKKLASAEFIPFSVAMNLLLEYLKPTNEALRYDPSYIESREAAMRLYESLQSASQLRRPLGAERFIDILKTDIFTMVDETLAKVGPRTVRFSTEDLNVARYILRKTPLANLQEGDEHETVPKNVQTYLFKGFLNKLYFLGDKIDPEFEIVLDMLYSDPAYAPAVATLFKDNSLFDQLYRDYCLRTDMQKYLPEIRQTLQAVPLARENSDEDPLGTKPLFAFCRISQLRTELKATPASSISKQQQSRAEWIQTRLNKSLANQIGYPPYFMQFDKIDCTLLNQADPNTREPIMFKLVATSLYAQDPTARNMATTALKPILNTLTEKEFPKGVYLSRLLHGWMLEQFMQGTHLDIQRHKELLYKIFCNYLDNEQSRNSWRSQYGIGFMESALYQFVTTIATNNNAFSSIFDRMNVDRVHQNEDAWKTTVKKYKEFTTHINENRNALLDGTANYKRLHKLLKEVLAIYEQVQLENLPKDTTTHLGIGWWCCTDMLLQYVHLRHDEFSTLVQQGIISPPEDPDEASKRVELSMKQTTYMNALTAMKAYENSTTPETRKIYRRAKDLIEDVKEAFGGYIPLDGDLQIDNDKISEARRLCVDLREKFVKKSTPWKPQKEEK